MFFILIAYIGLCFFIYIVQNKLLYFPFEDKDISHLKWEKVSSENELLGLEKKPVLGSHKTVIVFHGNGGSASMRDYYFSLIPNDYNLIVMEYPGYGFNHEEHTSRKNILDKARKLMRFVLSNHEDVILIGESLGTGVASQMAKEFNIKKLVLMTPYSTLEDVAQRKFWYLPVFILLKDKYDNIDNLKDFQGKVFILISQNDEVISPKFAEKLYMSLSCAKEKIIVPSASHSNWLDKMTLEQRHQLMIFFKS